MRGTPVLVLILATYYMPSGLGLSPGPITAGIIALTVFCASHVGETLRGALLAIPPAQTDAAPRHRPDLRQMLCYVLMPQAIRQIAPNFVNTAVEIVKASSLLSAIGVGELLLTTQEIIGRTFKTMEFYALAGAPLSRHQSHHRHRRLRGSNAAFGSRRSAAWNRSSQSGA